MKIKLVRKKRLFLLGIIILLLLSSAFFLVLSFAKPAVTKEEVPWFTYNQQSQVNYRVYLKPNSFFSESSVESGKAYLTNFVDYINTYFTYTLNGGRDIDFKGSYNVTAKLQAYVDKDKIAWEKDYVLLPETKFVGKEKTVALKQEIPIRFNDFVGFVNALNDVAEIIPSEVNLIVKWNVNIDMVTDKGTVKDQISPTMIVPLSKKSFVIGGELEKKKPGVLTVTRQVESPHARNLKVAYLVATVLFTVLLGLLVFKTSDSFAVIDPIQNRVSLILKRYRDRLAVIESEISPTAENIILTKSIDDLVKIADELNKPLLLKTGVDQETEAAFFYVLDEPLVFKYSVKE